MGGRLGGPGSGAQEVEQGPGPGPGLLVPGAAPFDLRGGTRLSVAPGRGPSRPW
jgi:hypothetical protein